MGLGLEPLTRKRGPGLGFYVCSEVTSKRVLNPLRNVFPSKAAAAVTRF